MRDKIKTRVILGVSVLTLIGCVVCMYFSYKLGEESNNEGRPGVTYSEESATIENKDTSTGIVDNTFDDETDSQPVSIEKYEVADGEF